MKRLLASLLVMMFSASAMAVTEYGDGPRTINITTPYGSGTVYCDFGYSSDEDDAYEAIVKFAPSTKLINYNLIIETDENAECAKNKAILQCSWRAELEYCEDNVKVYSN